MCIRDRSKIANQDVQQLFRERKVSKRYTAIVRGFVEQSGTINYALLNKDKLQEAATDYELIRHYELDLPFGKFNTSRYSHIWLKPQTGRYHQLRKHMAHIFHPIIGDRPHGCNKQNKLWKEKFGMMTMLLHAERLELEYPRGNPLVIRSDHGEEFERVLQILSSG